MADGGGGRAAGDGLVVQREAIGRLQPLGWAAVTIVSSLASFLLLTFAMRGLPLGTAYAVWTGIGAVGTFIIGIALMGDSAGVWRIASALLIVAGVIGLRLTSRTE